MTLARERDPAVLARARDLSWLAQRAMRGAPFGRHPGRDLGPGIEFSQYRNYEPGDDARWLDWRRLARGQDALVRLAPRDARLNISVVLDNSASMHQPGADGWTRADSARAVAATVLGIARGQGDAFHWLALQEHTAAAPDHHTEPGHTDAHLAHCIAALGRTPPSGAWPAPDAVRRTLARLPRDGLVLVISDFIAQPPAIEALAEGLQLGRRDIIALQLLTQDELEFGYRGNLELVDRESGQRVLTHAESVRDRYLAALESARSGLRRALQRRRIVLASALVEPDPQPALRPLLAAYERAHAARRAR